MFVMMLFQFKSSEHGPSLGLLSNPKEFAIATSIPTLGALRFGNEFQPEKTRGFVLRFKTARLETNIHNDKDKKQLDHIDKYIINDTYILIYTFTVGQFDGDSCFVCN